MTAMIKQKNLLFVQIQADLYGSSRSLLRLVGALDKKVYKIFVVVSGSGPLKQQLEMAGARVVEIPHVGAVGRWNLFSWKYFLIPFDILKAAMQLLHIIRREQIDLVHSNTSIILAAALAAKIAKIPHIFHIREIFDEFPAFWKIHRRFIRWSSQEIICISTAVAKQFPGQPVRIIQNGLDIDAECLIKPDPEKMKKELDLHGALLAGCIGRIKWRRKGQEVLIQALALLKERGMVMNALVVGSPFRGNEAHLQQLKALARRLGVFEQVRFLAEQPDVWPFYAMMDIFVMPSILPEPLGNVTLEAMAMGLPVIASRNGGSVDLVLDGRSGFLVRPGDSEALAEKLAYLVQHPQQRREMGEAGRQRQFEEFGLGRCVGRIDALYRRILNIPLNEKNDQA
jgi:glycosyltransferase involved in cell wall biosynthesis